MVDALQKGIKYFQMKKSENRNFELKVVRHELQST